MACGAGTSHPADAATLGRRVGSEETSPVGCDLALLKPLGVGAGRRGDCGGVPLDIVLGRWLWVLSARLIYAAPGPTAPMFRAE